MNLSNLPPFLVDVLVALFQLLQALIHFWMVVLQVLQVLVDELIRRGP